MKQKKTFFLYSHVVVVTVTKTCVHSKNFPITVSESLGVTFVQNHRRKDHHRASREFTVERHMSVHGVLGYTARHMDRTAAVDHSDVLFVAGNRRVVGVRRGFSIGLRPVPR